MSDEIYKEETAHHLFEIPATRKRYEITQWCDDWLQIKSCDESRRIFELLCMPSPTMRNAVE